MNGQTATELEKNREQYAVELVVHHIIMKTESHYIVHWYSYSSKENIFKPLRQLQKHFMDSYRHRKKSQSGPTKLRRNDGTDSYGTRQTRSNNQRCSL